VTRDLASYALLVGTAKAVQFLMLPVLTRLFTAKDFGAIELIVMTTGLLSIAMSLSMESAVARLWFDAAEQHETADLLGTALAFVTVFGSFVAFVFWAAATYWGGMAQHLDSAGVLVAVVAATALASALLAILQVTLRMQRRVMGFGILQITQAVLGGLLPVAFIAWWHTGVLGYALGTLGATVVTLVLGLGLVRGELKHSGSIARLKACLRYAMPLTPAVVITWANGQVDRLILLALAGMGVLGIYGAAARVAAAIALLVEVFRLAWVPVAMRQLDMAATRGPFFRRSLTAYAVVMCALGLVIVTFSKELMGLLTTSEYLTGYVAVPWLVGAQILYGSASITNAGMLATRKTAGNSAAAALGALANVTFGFALVWAFGLQGSAFGSMAAALVFTTLLLHLSARELHLPFDRAAAAGCLAIFIVASAVVLWLLARQPETSTLARSAVLAIAVGGIVLLGWRRWPRTGVPSDRH
jgi:O-antigen/teichoic acid export membrane protein